MRKDSTGSNSIWYTYARIEMLNKDQMDISINYSKLEDVKPLHIIFRVSWR